VCSRNTGCESSGGSWNSRLEISESNKNYININGKPQRSINTRQVLDLLCVLRSTSYIMLYLRVRPAVYRQESTCVVYSASCLQPEICGWQAACALSHWPKCADRLVYAHLNMHEAMYNEHASRRTLPHHVKTNQCRTCLSNTTLDCQHSRPSVPLARPSGLLGVIQ
jgi:hypothetical protein